MTVAVSYQEIDQYLISFHRIIFYEVTRFYGYHLLMFLKQIQAKQVGY